MKEQEKEQKQGKYPELPVLVIDDEKNFLKSIDSMLRFNGITNVECCDDSREVMPQLEENKFSLIILDIRMPDIDGKELLPQIVEKYPEIPVIVVTGYSETKIAVECMKAGAFDYLEKPLDTKELLEKVSSAINLPLHFSKIKTRSKIMQSIFHHIEMIAKTNMPVLITGESGVGKELVAKAIHKVSQRKGKFIAVNSAGLDDHLFSDTLFGHKKGAFTDARQEREGMIKHAQGGTLFLDEIGDLSVSSQIKLLRVIDQMEYCPLGSDVPVKTNARIVVATNRDLKIMRETKKFRTDFYYRLQVCEIHVPPLRDREEDIPVLVNYFLEKESKAKGRKTPKVSKESFKMLKNYDFPGNVRELENLIEYVVSRHRFRVLTPEVFQEKIKISAKREDSPPISGKIDPVFPQEKGILEKSFPTFSELEAVYFKEVMKQSNGVKAKAAKLAGKRNRTFGTRYDKIKKELEEKGQDFADLPDLADLLKTLI